MTIKIIGANTANGIKLKKLIIKVVNEIDGRVTINLIDDNTKSNLPLLYINNQLESIGTVPRSKEILRIIKKHYKD